MSTREKDEEAREPRRRYLEESFVLAFEDRPRLFVPNRLSSLLTIS